MKYQDNIRHFITSIDPEFNTSFHGRVAGSHFYSRSKIINWGSINTTRLVECRPCDPIVLTRHPNNLQHNTLQPTTVGQYFECIGKLHKLQYGGDNRKIYIHARIKEGWGFFCVKPILFTQKSFENFSLFILKTKQRVRMNVRNPPWFSQPKTRFPKMTN